MLKLVLNNLILETLVAPDNFNAEPAYQESSNVNPQSIGSDGTLPFASVIHQRHVGK
ncbi:MAG: hypothetical protein ACLTTW_02785 [Coprobacter sp.]